MATSISTLRYVLDQAKELSIIVIRQVMIRSLSAEIYTLLSICCDINARRLFSTGQPIPDAQQTSIANTPTTAHTVTAVTTSQPTTEKSNSRPKTPENLVQDQVITPDKNNNHKLVNFSELLSGKIQELGTMIENAQSFLLLPEIGEAATGHINNAVGSANLLIAGRFKQFGGLCDQHYGKSPPDEGKDPPTYQDLQGFYDLVFISFENIERQFNEIELWRSNGWKEPETQKRASPVKKTPTAGSSRPNTRPPSANSTASSKKASRGRNSSSALRDQIRAAKLAKKKEQELAQTNGTESLPETPKRTVNKDLSAGDAGLDKLETNSVPDV